MKKTVIPLAVGMLFVSGYFALWMMGGKISTPVVQMINWVILAAVIALSLFFVGRDTRRKAYSWPETIAWVLLSIATFPIGFGLYFILRTRGNQRKDANYCE